MRRISILIAATLLCAQVATAHQPQRETTPGEHTQEQELQLEYATEILDPTTQSVAVYGQLDTPQEVDLYTFTAQSTAEIPVEVLVPVRVSNERFSPEFVFIQQGSGNSIDELQIPEGYSAELVKGLQERDVFFEPFSVERLYHGNEKTVSVEAGETYYIAIFDNEHYTGDYSLGAGTIEAFEDANFIELIKEVVLIKLAIVGGREIPWLDIVGLFLLLAGFVIGLGAVTVIDLHGFLGRKSEYWTEATTRAHKVTKPLIWLGTLLATIGGVIYYRTSGLSSTATFHLVLLIIMVLNGLFLTFRVSPFLLKQEREGNAQKLLPKTLQRKITVSFVVSFVSWWSALFLLVWHLLVAR